MLTVDCKYYWICYYFSIVALIVFCVIIAPQYTGARAYDQASQDNCAVVAHAPASTKLETGARSFALSSSFHSVTLSAGVPIVTGYGCARPIDGLEG